MGHFYPPWVGPDKVRVWILIVLLVSMLVVAFIVVPVATCSANDEAGVCDPPVSPAELQGLGTLGTPMWRSCPCNASSTVRASPNARVLSNTFFANGEYPPTPEARGLSALSVSVLQFVLNDISGPLWDGSTSYPVPIPIGDPFFATPGNISVPDWAVHADGAGCPNPIMYTTPFIDLSNVYGVDPTRLNQQLRALRGGHMLLDPENNLLPYAALGDPFVMGDPRDGYTADLVALHTMLVRNHNAWADRVLAIHSGWTEEAIFWKARQLNVAEWQHILFHEWLPALLGSVAPPPVSTLTAYNPALLQAVRLEVAAVVGPAFVDTLTPNAYGTISWSSQHGVTAAATLIQTEGTISNLLVDMVGAPALAFDDKSINGRRNLYVNGSTQDPEDLIVTHVQRARVLRIPDWAATYTCFGTTAIAGDSRDAYQGFLEENIYPGTSMGLTGASMLGAELGRLRDADPNFYSFNRAKIGQIFWKDVVRGSMLNVLIHNAGLTFPELSGTNLFFAPRPEET
jgi:peroxidase